MSLSKALRFWIPEAALLAGGYWVYATIRDREGMAAYAGALRHGEWIMDVERAVDLDQEHRLQVFMLRSPEIVRFLDTFWSYGYLIGTIGVLVWLGVWQRESYRRLRRTFVAATVVGLVVFAAFPAVPPRLLPPSYGILDTWIKVGGVGAQTPPHIESIADPFASMPSLHVAWSVWCAMAVISHTGGYDKFRSWAIRSAAVLYPLLTAFCVLVTGNHYILDCLAGALLVPLSALALRLISRFWILRQARHAAIPSSVDVPSYQPSSGDVPSYQTETESPA